MALRLRPVTLRDANAYVATLHRHHQPTRGHRWSVAVEDDGRLCGVAIVGRPVARGSDDGRTAEVLRTCTDGTRNACSFLLSAAARAAAAMGYRKIQTYTLASEPGTSLRAAGWTLAATTRGGSWDCPTRPRADKAPTEPKRRWEKELRQ